jgi:hypothetical protein
MKGLTNVTTIDLGKINLLALLYLASQERAAYAIVGVTVTLGSASIIALLT